MSHEHILAASGSFPARELIKQWLKAGYVDHGVFHDTPTGTAQGAVISPLLANAALHGLEAALGVKGNAKGATIRSRAVVRYADDFAVFCESRAEAEETIDLLKKWLADRGLTLSPEKTRIVHVTEGCDVLGFTMRLYKRPRTRTGYRLLVTPSQAAEQARRNRRREEWLRLRSQPLAAVLARLNPRIRGWAT